MKYLRNLNNHNDYTTFIAGTNFAKIQATKDAVVSYCRAEDHVHYNPYVPTAQLLDILYSDANGNLSFTSKVLPASEGKTPIGLCIATAGFFGENEPARWMSLKYMSCTAPETGSLISDYGYCWGNLDVDISTIDNINITYNGGSESGYLTADWIKETSYKIPTLFTKNNEWNISVLGTVNAYAVTDIDGKNKTNKILATATTQTTWQTDTEIEDADGEGYAPAACCCARYHTSGTQAGDWYLGACGEMSIIVVQKQEINNKLAQIATQYPNDCISSLDENNYWTSTEINNESVYRISIVNGHVYISDKDETNNVIGMLAF